MHARIRPPLRIPVDSLLSRSPSLIPDSPYPSTVVGPTSPCPSAPIPRSVSTPTDAASLGQTNREARFHDLRAPFASRALALGESLSMIGKLLGHNKIDTTARYAHLARDSIKASSARVADSIGADILDRTPRETEPA